MSVDEPVISDPRMRDWALNLDSMGGLNVGFAHLTECPLLARC